MKIKDSFCNKHCRISLHDVGGKLVQTLDSGVGWGWGMFHGDGSGMGTILFTVSLSSLDPLKCIFLAYNISALRGCCALKFLRALEIEEGLLANTPGGTGVPLKNFNRENLKSGLKFGV